MPFLPGGLHNISQTPNPEPEYNSGIGSPLHLFCLDRGNKIKTEKPCFHGSQYSIVGTKGTLYNPESFFYPP